MPPLNEHKDEVLSLLQEGVGTKKIGKMYGVSRNAVVRFRNRWVLRENKSKVLRMLSKGVSHDDIADDFGVSDSAVEEFIEWADKPEWKFKKSKIKGLLVNKSDVLKDHKAGVPNYILAKKYQVTPGRVSRFLKTHSKKGDLFRG